MKKLIALGLIFVLLPVLLPATGTHTVTLTWTASVDGGAYTVYRASGTCSATATFTAVTSGVAVTTYADSGLAPGNFCYQVTTVVNGAESAPSNQAPAVILPASPAGLSVAIK